MKLIMLILYGNLLLSSTSFAQKNHILDQVEELYEKYGETNYMLNEKVTQKSHVLQAAFLALVADAPEDVIISLLLHDIGQIASPKFRGNVNALHQNHDDIGAEWLKARDIQPFIRDFVRYHTMAKVFICADDNNYLTSLSPASKESYFIQKAKLESPAYAKNAAYIINHPRLDDIKMARIFDDLAKLTQLNEDLLPDFSFYKLMFDRVQIKQSSVDSPVEWKQTARIWHDLFSKHPEIFLEQIRNLTYIHCK